MTFYTVHFAPALLLHQYLPRPLTAVPISLVPRLSQIKMCEYKLYEWFYGQSSDWHNRHAQFLTKLNMSGN